VSRHHLRHDKTCLNCGFLVEERYCSHCGQENTEPKESLGHLIGHFFADITHFDSKFFTTLKDLVFRPGFLTREYVAGRRLRYLNPIRMYVFISAVFFLVLFAGQEEQEKAGEETHAANVFRQRFADSLRAAGKQTDGGQGVAGGDSIRKNINGEIAAKLDTTEKVKAGEESIFFAVGGPKIVIDLVENKYRTVREYDSIESHLPDSSRNTGLWGWVMRRNVQLKEEHGGRSRIHIEQNLQHTIPKIMFVLLPLFALFTGWFYSRKKYYYVQHAFFSIHYHSFVFLLFLVVLLAGKVISSDKVNIILTVGAIAVAFVYLVAGLMRMYGQSLWLSLGKAMAICLLYLVSIVLTLWTLVALAFIRA
jgi:hypothetical protein